MVAGLEAARIGAKPTTMIRDSRSDVYIADLTGGSIEKIGTNPGADGFPAWSPDGRFISWSADPNAAKRSAMARCLPTSVMPIWFFTMSTPGRLRIVWSRDFDVDIGAARWSADSRQILFVSGKVCIQRSVQLRRRDR